MKSPKVQQNFRESGEDLAILRLANEEDIRQCRKKWMTRVAVVDPVDRDVYVDSRAVGIPPERALYLAGFDGLRIVMLRSPSATFLRVEDLATLGDLGIDPEIVKAKALSIFDGSETR